MSLFLDPFAVKKVLLSKIKEVQDDVEDWKCEVRGKDEKRSKDNFASFIYFADLINNRANKKISLFVKVMPENLQMHDVQNSENQFYNENVMYERVLPLMIQYSGLGDKKVEVSSLIPKFYYANYEAQSAMIVLENLTVQGYKLANFNFDYQHCVLAMEGLGRYHALSYEMKHNYNDMFQKHVVRVVKEARYNQAYRSVYNQTFFHYLGTHPLIHIQKSEDPELIAFREKHAEFLKQLEESLKTPVKTIEDVMIPQEPLAVLTHGDFNRNNIMYRYDEEGHPVHVKFYDFQTVRYSSPASDFVFFIFFNMSPELRRDHLDDLLRCYQKVVVDSLVESTLQTREEIESVYSVKAFKENFKRLAVYGYIISSMFIHYMLATTDELKKIQQDWLGKLSVVIPPEDYLRCVAELGGEEAMRRSVAIIKDMAEMQ